MAIYKLIPGNILFFLIHIITFYLLFESVRRKILLQKVLFLSLFIFSLSTSIINFIESKALSLNITLVGLVISGVTLIIGLVISYRKGDNDIKERVKGIAVLLTIFILLPVIILFVVGRYILPFFN